MDHETIADVVAELAACFPVYRSYLPEGREHLDRAVELARGHRPDLAAVLDAVVPVLADPDAEPAQRFQQTTGAVMAKGVEDCAFYRFSRLTSLNEVGGDPSEFSLRPADFHTLMTARQAERPHAMTTLSTHDTKRGEDVRARITALAELPYEWEAALDQLLRAVATPGPRLRLAALAGRARAPGRRRASACTRTPRRRCARPATGPRGPRPTSRTRTPSTQPWTRPSTIPRCEPSSTSCSTLVVAPGWSNALVGQADRR